MIFFQGLGLKLFTGLIFELFFFDGAKYFCPWSCGNVLFQGIFFGEPDLWTYVFANFWSHRKWNTFSSSFCQCSLTSVTVSAPALSGTKIPQQGKSDWQGCKRSISMIKFFHLILKDFGLYDLSMLGHLSAALQSWNLFAVTGESCRRNCAQDWPGGFSISGLHIHVSTCQLELLLPGRPVILPRKPARDAWKPRLSVVR